MRKIDTHAIVILIASVACSVHAPIPPAAPPVSALQLSDCSVTGVAGPARCGSFTVLEDRTQSDGRKISLNLVVLPALHGSSRDAVTFLAGGPGQAATEGLAGVARELTAIRETRDLVFFDQRGTGKSNSLQCNLGNLAQSMIGWMTGAFNPDSLLACRRRLPADVRKYTTLDAIHDLDEVRAALGYDQLDLIGVSYGSRMALEYMRRYPSHSRVAVLRGVYPPNAKLPLFVAREADATLARRSSECAANPDCRANSSNLRNDVMQALESLTVHPRRIPLDSRGDTLTLTREIAASALLFSLYSYEDPQELASAAKVALRGEYTPLLGRGLLLAATAGNSFSNGMYLSVVCASDVPFISDREAVEVTANTFIGSTLVNNLRRSCAAWGAPTQPSEFTRPVSSVVPTLVISGDSDPVAAPIWGDATVRFLDRGVHLVVPQLGHVPWTNSCLNNIMTKLVESGSTSGLDMKCQGATSVTVPKRRSGQTLPRSPRIEPPKNIRGLWDLHWTRSGKESAASGWIRLCPDSADASRIKAVVGGQGELPASGRLIGDSLHLTGRRLVEFTVAGRFVGEELRGALMVLTSNQPFIARRREGKQDSAGCRP